MATPRKALHTPYWLQGKGDYCTLCIVTQFAATANTQSMQHQFSVLLY